MSVVKDWAAILIPSAMVRYGLHRPVPRPRIPVGPRGQRADGMCRHRRSVRYRALRQTAEPGNDARLGG
ncbi:hypothetical protein J2S64_002563 [Paeniglutamicibacter sulfureus]|uniref:Uncharacterized protein n=1 Tax=Paeniglutamicibacter sulfureus TaxID=43666 RepID=A0ABU2BJP3_9MICC|nr:hypothetical protein [Paeniglutamicibacter sulfureus]